MCIMRYVNVTYKIYHTLTSHVNVHKILFVTIEIDIVTEFNVERPKCVCQTIC